MINLKHGIYKIYTADSPEIQAIVRACQKKSIIEALGRNPKKDPIKFVGNLLRR